MDTPESAELLVRPGNGIGCTIPFTSRLEEVVGPLRALAAAPFLLVIPDSPRSFASLRLTSLRHGSITAQRNRKVMSITYHRVATARLSPCALSRGSHSTTTPESEPQ